MKSIHILIALLTAQIQQAFIYRGMMLIWMFHVFFVPLVMLLVWLSIATHNPHLNEQRDMIIAYYLLLPIIGLLTGTWHAGFFARKVRNGNLNLYLTKPLPYILTDLANNIAEKVVKLLILLPMIIIAWIYFSPSISSNGVNPIIVLWILFISFWIKFLYESVVAYLAFWLDNISGIINFTDIAEYTIGGRFIPLFLFPPNPSRSHIIYPI